MGNEKRDIPQWCRDAKKAMLDLGVSGPKELGILLGGRSRTHISMVLNGKVVPSDELKNQICSFLSNRLAIIGIRYPSLEI